MLHTIGICSCFRPNTGSVVRRLRFLGKPSVYYVSTICLPNSYYHYFLPSTCSHHLFVICSQSVRYLFPIFSTAAYHLFPIISTDVYHLNNSCLPTAYTISRL